MRPRIYITPLKRHLSKVITPKQLARLLDELAFDYSRMTMRLQQTEDKLQLFYHPEASDFLYHIKELRDVLKKCKA